MYKNIVIGVLLLTTIIEGGYILTRRSEPKVQGAATRFENPGSPRPSPSQPVSAGMKLSDSSVSKFAYKVAPGTLDDNAKAALVGWNISSVIGNNGSTVVTLSPKNSDDQKQVYTIKSGQSLYFVEMTNADDNQQSDSDKNLRDDYGIIVNYEGIIQ